MKKTQIVISGDNVETLKNYPDNYFDSVVTDCPYGLGKEPNAEEMLKAWIDTGYLEVKGSGFMGKEWDSFVPQPLFWKEIYRVLKYGGHIVAFFGTRTYDWGCMAIRLGGFEIRDCIQWVYGSGFPKSHNVGKAVDKIQGNDRIEVGKYKLPDVLDGLRKKDWDCSAKSENSNFGASGQNILTKGFTDWEGWGSALKPANEPIVLARKPLEKGLSIAENMLKWGTGGINIDVSRIKLEDNYKPIKRVNSYHDGSNNEWLKLPKLNGNSPSANSQGRFPSNFIMTHHEDCECIGIKKVGKGERKQHQDGEISNANEGYRRPNKSSFTHKDSSVIANYGEETIEDWNCVDDCPIKILDEQSGITESKKNERGNVIDNNVYGKYKEQDDTLRGHNDKGGASRFFYVAKASQWERNYGLDGFEEKNSASSEFRPNHLEKSLNGESGNPYGRWKPLKNIHPTIKPIKLMQYLIRLVTQPNGIVLDAFAGSGTTGIACKIDGFEFVGLELSEEFTAIANQRIKSFNEEKLLLDETIVFKTRNKKEKTDTNTQTKEQLNLF